MKSFLCSKIERLPTTISIVLFIIICNVGSYAYPAIDYEKMRQPNDMPGKEIYQAIVAKNIARSELSGLSGYSFLHRTKYIGTGFVQVAGVGDADDWSNFSGVIFRIATSASICDTINNIPCRIFIMDTHDARKSCRFGFPNDCLEVHIPAQFNRAVITTLVGGDQYCRIGFVDSPETITMRQGIETGMHTILLEVTTNRRKLKLDNCYHARIKFY